MVDQSVWLCIPCVGRGISERRGERGVWVRLRRREAQSALFQCQMVRVVASSQATPTSSCVSTAWWSELPTSPSR
ncbi:hypothetical protein E2C01_037287 [Portunus trituberculatus]|uniref:Uncharacterized protein n=1 Tax=Portunus trituberculatus TaxID=210409 RepID=A0A5B7FDT0_PORTR|nr:hypothetical protein [Portunus trituberculatus]